MKPPCSPLARLAPRSVAQDMPGAIRLQQPLFVYAALTLLSRMAYPDCVKLSLNVSDQRNIHLENDVKPCYVAQVRNFVRAAVLSTDMAQHSKLSEQLREAKATLAAAAVQRRQAAHAARRSATSRAAVPQPAAQPSGLGRRGAAEQRIPQSLPLPSPAAGIRMQGRSPAGAVSGDAATEVKLRSITLT